MQLFAAALRERARELGIANAEVARRAQLTDRRYGNYVAGIREPDLSTLVRIAIALETTPDRLLGFAPASTMGDDPLRRLASAARRLSPADVEGLVAQAEALASFRARAAAENKRGSAE